jgi:amidase
LCGLVGMKPTRGALPSPYGALDLVGISSLGPLAHGVRDAAALLDVIAGSRGRFAIDPAIPRLQVRVLASSPLAAVDPEVAAATHAVAARIEALGAMLADAPEMVAEIDDFLPLMAKMVAQLPLVFGMRRRLEPTTLWLHERGSTVTRAAAIAAGHALGRRVVEWFGDADVIVMPTVGGLAPRIGEFAGLDGEATFRAAARLGVFTALTVPAARSRSGLPIGVQLVGRAGSDRLLLSLAAALGY